MTTNGGTRQNSFQHPISEVGFGAYLPEDVEEAMVAAEALARRRVESLLGVPPAQRDFENTALALAEVAEELVSVKNMVDHLARVLGGPWHPVNEAAAERESRFRNELRFHQGLYRALLELKDRAGYLEGQSAARQKYLDETVLNYRRDGIELSEEKQAQLKQDAAQLSAAEVAFTRNLMEASDAAGLAIAGRAGLDGLSDEFVDGCREAAEAKGLEGYWVTYNQPNYVYVMANCRVRATRQALYRAHAALAADLNVAVAQEVLSLRRHMAQLLGYRDFSDYVLEMRMAKDGATAASFIHRLAELYRPVAHDEHEALSEFARRSEADPGLVLDASDVPGNGFYVARLKAEQVGVDEEELRDYLYLANVREVMFSVLGDLYGVVLKRVVVPAWHEDVEVYEVWDGDCHLSTVWCDWYARKGKSGGAWADAFYTAPRAGGEVKTPSLLCVVCNFPPPDGSGQSRLSLRDVETLWHEFGHCLHMTFSMTELRQQSALNSRWDFIEAPSQIMENWVWEPSVLSRLARHYQSGEGLDAGVMARLLASRNFRAATAAMRQFSYATEDLVLHREYAGGSAEDLLQLHRRTRQGFLPVPLYAEEAPPASFRHIFGSSAYASAYYSYKWAEAIEADLFSAFEGCPLSREVGTRYRRQVLERGAEAEPDQLIMAFLGRPTTPAAMLRRDGVTATGAARPPEEH